jgi:hypothetical protein
VLKNGFDDPKFRWIVDQSPEKDEVANHALWQISGYIPFHGGLNRRDQYNFKAFEKEDRWGDLEGLPLEHWIWTASSTPWLDARRTLVG